MSDTEQRRPAPRDGQQSDRPPGGDRFGRPGGRFGAGAQGGRPDGDGGPRGPRGRRPSGGGRYAPRRKVCQFCVDGIGHVDYKDLPRLRRHVGERGKIEPRRKLGTCAKHQRSVTTAIKRARFIGLIPFTTSAGRG